MKLKFTLIALVAMLSSFAVNAANSQQVDVVLPTGVSESAFGDNTVTDGTNYYATLQAATEAVVGNADAVLYCKPSADVGSLQHAPVTATLTVYGNGASVTGGAERDFDFGNTDPTGGKDITADMTLTVKNLNGCGAWGTKATEHTVNLVFEGCGNMGKVLAYGTTGTLNITMNDCAFEGVLKEAIYSNADGAITLNNVAFSNLNKAINLNHKAAGTQTVTINGCSFTNCGNDVAADQIPVRVLTSVEGGKSVLNVSNTTFTGTPEGGADILLDYGVGVTEATVTNTEANVLPENKENNAEMVSVTKNEGYSNVALTEVKVATLAELQAALADNSNELQIIITETIVIPQDETVVIDLNGKTVTRQDEATNYAINNLGTLTIQDTKGNGSINARGIYNGYVNGGANVASAKITVLSGTINAKGTNGGGAAIFNYGVADIQGGTFTSVASYAIALQTGSTMIIGENAIITGGINSWQSTLTVNGGTISNDKSGKHVVYAGQSIVTINGGTFYNSNSGNATIMASGATAAVEINGGTFGIKDGRVPGDGNTWTSCLTDTQDSATMTVNGGTFNGGFRVQAGTSMTINGGSFNDIYGSKYNIYGTVTVTGGTFTDDTAEAFATKYVAEGYELGEDGKVTSSIAYVAKIGEQGYATLTEAFAAVTDDAQTVVVLQDVTEELTGAYLRGNITTENGAKVTINLTNSDWVYCPYTFVLGENITLNVPALFYYAGGAQINGTVVTDAYYQRYAGTKLTINEPGSMTVTSEMCYLRYTDGDANAGIYVNGDNNNETVGLNLSVAYFYQGMIYAKDANIKTAVYWQTNETDNQGSANLVLDNSTLNVTVNEHDFKATGNSTVTLTNSSSIVIAGAFKTGENTEVSVDATSSITDKNGQVKFGLSGEGTEANPFLISSVDDLVLFRNSVNAGETKYNAEGVYVALGANIDLAGVANWSPIGTWDYTFDANFDGKGKKIMNLKMSDNTAANGEAYLGFFGITANNEIKNLVIENVTIESAGQIVAAAIAYPYYTKVSDITVCGNIAIKGGNYTAGVLAYTRLCQNASNLAVVGDEGSCIEGAQVVGGVIADIQMNNGLVANYSNFSAEGVAVKGTKMVGGISGIIATQTLNGAAVKNVTLSSGDSRVGTIAGAFGGTSTISNVTVENVTGATALVGATYDGGEPVQILEHNGVYTIKSQFLSGDGTEANPYLISNVEDLLFFRNSVNAGETKYNVEGVYVALGADIDLAGIDWSVNIGDDCAVTFDGIFDGKGFTISNLTATETATKADGYICTGLFGAIYDKAVVKNFTLENVTINAPYVGNNVSAVVGFAYACKGSIEDVKVVGVNINAPEATGVGAIVGYDYYSPALTVKNCVVKGNDGSAIVGKSYTGGLVGYASSKIAMNNNTIEDVTVSATASVGAVAGIMLGGGSATDNTVKNVTLTANGALWANSSAVVAGTITGGAVTVSNTNVENVTANGAEARIVGGILVEKPTTAIAKVQAQIGDVYYTTFAKAVAAAQADETIVLIADAEVVKDETITLNGVNLSTLEGVTLTNNGTIEVKGEVSLDIATLAGSSIDFLDGAIVKNSTIGGSVFVAGNVTFRGANTFAMLYDYGTLTDYYGTTAPMKWTVEEGASVTLTNAARYGLGYGDDVTVYGNIENALEARENLTDADRSLFMHGLVAQESKGWNCDSKFTVENAYVAIGSNNSFGNKSGNYGGTYTFNIKNSVVDASRITFYEALSTTTFTFDGCDVKMGTFMTRDADSKFILKNSKVLSTTASNGTDEGNYNKGELTLENSTLTYSAEFKHEAGVINLDLNSLITAPKISGVATIKVDATGVMEEVVVIAGDMSAFTGTIEVVDGDYKITDAGLVVYNASYISEYTIDDANSVDFTNDAEKTVGTLTYKRTLIEGIWNPLYLPFEISVEELVDNYDIAYYNQMISFDTDNDGAFDDYEMEVAYITTGTLRANYPYFIRPKNAEACALEYVAEDVTLYPAVEKQIVTSSVANIFTLSGTHKAMGEEELDGYLAISLDGRWTPSTGIKAHRLYFKIEENDNSPFATTRAKSIRIVVAGEGTTGVEGVKTENAEVETIYDLSGRRVLEVEKGGIYIVNGVKTLVK